METMLFYLKQELEKWYSLFAIAELAAIATLIQQNSFSIFFHLGLIALGLSLLSFVLSVYRSMLKKRNLFIASSKMISGLSASNGKASEDVADRKDHAIHDKKRDDYSGRRWRDTEAYNLAGLALFAAGTVLSSFALVDGI